MLKKLALGDKSQVKFTVKGQNEYKGTKETIITRAKEI